MRASLIQVCQGEDINANLDGMMALLNDAKEHHPNLILTPESSNFMSENVCGLIEAEAKTTMLSAIQDFAKKSKIWVVVGSLLIKEDRHNYNRQYVIDDKGNIVTRYDKIHMFDVDVPNGESHRESATFKAGTETVVTKTPLGVLGHSICYDLRFPYLYKILAKKGADFLCVPAAFTYKTGQAGHWEILLRARALENGCYVFAPAQSGQNTPNRKTWGHSMIVDPWGKVIAMKQSGNGVITHDIDLDFMYDIRKRIPAMQI